MSHGTHAVARSAISPTHRLPRSAAAFAAGLVLVLAPAASGEEKPVDLCENPVSQNDLTACAWQGADKANADMLVALAKAMKAMAAIDRDVNEVRPNPAGGVQALELSQEGWLRYREGRCIIKGFDERGGSMEPMIAYHCEEEMTRARIAELNELAEE